MKVRQVAYLILKRVTDIVLSALGLILASPILFPVMFLVWKQDRHSPFYIAERIGRNFIPFKMIKLRSMVKNADQNGVDSTSNTDLRITPIGKFIRRNKLDELTQLWNVLVGQMSLVGPRPNVVRETDLYTPEERLLLTVKPGITDYASIVFADEGEILSDKVDPDLAYNQLIRPGKSQLGIFYVRSRSIFSDLSLIAITLVSLFNRKKALSYLSSLLSFKRAPLSLIRLALRQNPLIASMPPGATKKVETRSRKVD